MNTKTNLPCPSPSCSSSDGYSIQDDLRKELHYNPATGVFTRITVNRKSEKRFIGTVAGRIDSWGHRQIGLHGKKYAAHRLAWLYMTGQWPSKTIDHKNTIPDDNRWENLREATQSEQGCNKNISSRNTSGYKGVSWYPRYNKWVARISFQGEKKTLGYFENILEAAEAYKKASVKYHKEFSRV